MAKKIQLGLPYMGSKRKLAKEIVDFILHENPNCEYFYDMFGGGGAIAIEAASRPQIKKVFYNELNTGIFSLMNKLLTDKTFDFKFYDWVSREEFNKHNYDENWYGGFLSCCWSFGSKIKGGGYLYGKSVESLKEKTHNEIFENIIIDSNINHLYLYNLVTENRLLRNKVTQNQHLERISRVFEIFRYTKANKFEISNKSFFDVEINTSAENTVIYLDPPYHNTTSYTDGISHDDLYKHIEQLSDYQIYESGYESELEKVYEMNHRCSLSAKSNTKTKEYIFCNKPKINEWFN